MRQQDKYVIFDTPVGELRFHQDLKQYVKICEQFQKKYADIKAEIQKIYNKDKILSTVTVQCLDFIQTDIIPRLADMGFYDITDEDFIVDNPGYEELFSENQQFQKYKDAVTKEAHQISQNAKAKAANEISQSITGMGFGVISNDPLAHALYLAQSKSVLEKQTSNAQFQYNVLAQKIDSSAFDTIYRTNQEYADNKYFPAALRCLNQIFEYFISKYCIYCEQAGLLDLTCLDEINEIRSTKLLDNFSTVPNKEKLIYQCLQLCPYNLNVYQVIYMGTYQTNADIATTLQSANLTGHKGIEWTPDLIEMLQYFELNESFCAFIWKSCEFDLDSVQDTYNLKLRAIRSLSILTKQPEKDIANQLMSDTVKKRLEPYREIAQHLQSGQLLFHLMKAKFPQNYNSQLIYCLKDYLLGNRLLPGCHLLKEDEITFCKEKCNLNVWEILSDYFGQKFSSYDEVDQYILSVWDAQELDAKKAKLEEQIAAINQELSKAKEELSKHNIKNVTGFILLPFIFLVGFLSIGFGLAGLGVFPSLSLLLMGGLMVYGAWMILSRYLNDSEKVKSLSQELSAKTAKLEELSSKQTSKNETVNVPSSSQNSLLS